MSVRMATLSPSLIRPIATPAQGALHRHARVHQGQRAAADRGHRRRAVRLEDLGDHPEGVGEGVEVRQQRLQRPLGQRAVPDLPAAGAADRPDFAGRVGREVVVEHERLGRFARGTSIESIRCSSSAVPSVTATRAWVWPRGEQRRAVGPRQQPGLDRRSAGSCRGRGRRPARPSRAPGPA